MLDYDMKDHSVRLMVNDPVAVAYEWIKAWAENLSAQDSGNEDYGHRTVTMDELIDTAMTHVEAEPASWGGDFISNGGQFEGTYVPEIFWDHLAALKGIEIPETNRNNFFSCSC